MELKRKRAINQLVDFIAEDFMDSNHMSLTRIAEYEDVRYYFDHYEDAFDGMLLYDNSDFHIHINLDSGNSETSKRGRFTFAHELGHFFLDEHRLGLRYGLLEPHSSFHNLNQKSLIEIEADYFASCLLMPQKMFRTHSGGKKFSLDTILSLSDSFQASVPSTIIRFAEIGTHEICAVVSKGGIVQWYAKSENFPLWTHKFKRGEKLPTNTVAGEYYTLPDRKYTSIEKVDADAWFNPPKEDRRAHRQMYEQCYYSDSYEYVVSLLWFD
jgi:Zn-dependent peptidase ImmA (M78 family)